MRRNWLPSQGPSNSGNGAQDKVGLAACCWDQGVLLGHARKYVGGNVRLELVSDGEIESVSTGGADARRDKVRIIREITKFARVNDEAF
jgi:hypothetical protein